MAGLPAASVFQGEGSAERIHRVFNDNQKDVQALTARVTELETENTSLIADKVALEERVTTLESLPRVKVVEIDAADVTTSNAIIHNFDDPHASATWSLDDSPGFVPWREDVDDNSFNVRFGGTPTTHLKVVVLSFKPQG